jgi:hypothetical protein
MLYAALVISLVAACGHSSGPSWTEVTWSPVHGEIEGVGFSAQVPDKLPACAVPACWTNDPKPENDVYLPGPSFRVELKPRTFADAAAFEQYVQHDQCPDAKVDAANGRFHTSCHGEHGDPRVRVWIPLDDKRGLECTATWWSGPNKKGERAAAPPAAWLERFCASVQLDKH